MYQFFKKWAFKKDAEDVHHFVISKLNYLNHLKFFRKLKNFKVDFVDQQIRSPFGIAAGLDKNAQAMNYFETEPIGFLEVGTVTKLAQEGNPKPRLFRLLQQESLLNRMGFNNDGLDLISARVKKFAAQKKKTFALGINIGKNKNTPNDRAKFEYAELYKALAPYADYLVINISSPNTQGLRDLLNETGMRGIFEEVDKERTILTRPLFIKISPDMQEADLDVVIKLSREFKLTGIIATNTTIMPEMGEGGVSGKLLFERALKVRHYLLDQIPLGSGLVVVGAGGFSEFEQLIDFWRRGGSVVQIYSAYIFQGPQIFFDWEKKLVEEFRRLKVKTFSEYLLALRSEYLISKSIESIPTTIHLKS